MMVCIGILPGYYTIGIYAPLLLVLTRFFLEIFATGESVVANIYMIEKTRSSYRGRVTSLFQSSTVIGIIMASSVSAVIYNSGHPELYWRWAFIAGMIVALPGMYIRIQNTTVRVPCRQSTYTVSKVIHLLYQEKSKVLKVIAVSGFSYLPYVIPFVFFNNFVPRITDIAQSDMIYVNTMLLYVDMILFPIIGYHADKLPPKKMMTISCLFLMIIVVPAFLILPHSNIVLVSCIKLVMIVPGIAFVIPMYTWLNSLFDIEKKYLLVGVGYGIGSTIFGRSAPALCLWLWSITSSVLVPAIYIICVGVIAFVVLTYPEKKA